MIVCVLLLVSSTVCVTAACELRGLSVDSVNTELLSLVMLTLSCPHVTLISTVVKPVLHNTHIRCLTRFTEAVAVQTLGPVASVHAVISFRLENKTQNVVPSLCLVYGRNSK